MSIITTTEVAMTQTKTTRAPLADEDREWLRAYVAAHGEPAAMRETNLARNTIARGIAGLPLYIGSRSVIQAARKRYKR